MQIKSLEEKNSPKIIQCFRISFSEAGQKPQNYSLLIFQLTISQKTRKMQLHFSRKQTNIYRITCKRLCFVTVKLFLDFRTIATIIKRWYLQKLFKFFDWLNLLHARNCWDHSATPFFYWYILIWDVVESVMNYYYYDYYFYYYHYYY